MNLNINVVSDQQEHIIKLSGEIDVHTFGGLRDALLSLTDKPNNKVSVDLQEVTYLDSTGLGMFVAAYKSAQKNNSNLMLINVQERIFRLFKITGLDTIIDVRG